MQKNHRRFLFNKLGRDKNYTSFLERGMKLTLKDLSPKEYIQALKQKLYEETDEACKTESQQEMLEELGDVLEVVHALAQAYDSTFEAIEVLRKAKYEKHGGFTTPKLVIAMTYPADDPYVEYHLKNPSRTPEIPLEEDDLLKKE